MIVPMRTLSELTSPLTCWILIVAYVLYPTIIGCNRTLLDTVTYSFACFKLLDHSHPLPTSHAAVSKVAFEPPIPFTDQATWRGKYGWVGLRQTQGTSGDSQLPQSGNWSDTVRLILCSHLHSCRLREGHWIGGKDRWGYHYFGTHLKMTKKQRTRIETSSRGGSLFNARWHRDFQLVGEKQYS